MHSFSVRIPTVTSEGGGGPGRGRPNRSLLILNESDQNVKDLVLKISVPVKQGFRGLQEFGCKAGDFAALAGGQRHVAEALLAAEGLDEDR